MSRKSQRRKSVLKNAFDPEVVKEIEGQLQKKDDIEKQRKKQKLIFWSLVLSGAVVVTAAVLSFLFLLLEW